ncbi:HAMP domain-containing sensor histidine kinase [Oleiagrimonas sp. C23AA]|uniref:sensor histidine kinase n=1 Tax=Oleiagrimonas sp. C23AA TaxID=2719047 RepID=UPI00142205BE|nr:HAMP domain-containing sensor histidine kinase [Oleiagrimonas sp. C23AA]NII11108.1 HAMP domain-containing histidine kinase [Oleiagrimonas sp. C23AA]
MSLVTAILNRENGTKTAAFRTGVGLALVFGVIALILFVITWFAVRNYVEQQLQQNVKEEAAEIAGVPAARRAQVITRLASQKPDGPYFYGYRPKGSDTTLGNLPMHYTQPGWHSVSIQVDGRRVELLAKAVDIPGGMLAVARNRNSEDALEDILQGAFVAAGLLSMLLALAAGWFTARRYLVRIEQVSESATRIADGDLTARIQPSGKDDEFDRLAYALNSMLERIQQLMEGMRQVSSDIAHDLRTPLTHLRQNLEQVMLQGEDLPSYQRAVEKAVLDVDRVLETFAALLRIARIESQPLRTAFQTIDLTDLVVTVVDDYKPVFEDQGRKLRVELLPCVYCLGDRALLLQLLANLLENTLNHTPEGTPVTVSFHIDDTHIHLSVTDRGPGIDPAYHDYVFRRFARLDTARSMPGSGLGMAMVAAISERHGIKIRLLDAAPGLRVSLQIPRAFV